MSGQSFLRSATRPEIKYSAALGCIYKPAIRAANVVGQNVAEDVCRVAHKFFQHDCRGPNAAEHQHGVQEKCRHNGPQSDRFESSGPFNHFSETVI